MKILRRKHVITKHNHKEPGFLRILSIHPKHLKRKALILLSLPLFLTAQTTFGVPVANKERSMSLPPTFLENKGQVRDQNYEPRPDVLFSGTARGMVFHLRNNGISYQLSRAKQTQTETYRLDVNWLGTNENVGIKTDNTLKGHDNFYYAQAILDVKTYAGVVYQNIYDNIDLHYYEKNGDLKYDYIVAPHADYKQIRLEVKGAEKITLQENGSILFSTPMGEILEGAPLVYQSGKRIEAAWKIINKVLSFEVADYNHSLPLLIDPATRVWGTYYGAGSAQFLGTNANGCSADASGNVFFVGLTDAAGTGIATSGAHQVSLGGGFGDAFLVKFNSAGVRQWGTYYGGSGSTASTNFNMCKADASGNVYAGGASSASNGISTSGAHQPVMSSNNDAILIKFDNAGIRQWGTYYGDTGTDDINDIAIDATGNVYVVGRTSSANAISTAGSHQAAFGGGIDAFLVKFNSSGVRQWGTYYGDSGTEYGYSMGIDASANIYIAGSAGSTSGIATTGCHQPALGGGPDDAFLAKFNSNGVRQWGTYYGGAGAGFELISGCDVDPGGNVFIMGYTESTTGISSTGAYQAVHAGGPTGFVFDAFLVKFNAAGVRQWGTYFGGSGEDRSADCVCDPFGNVIIVGETNSTSAIATAGNHQTTLAGNKDAFIAKFNGTGTNVWSTYYGGPARDVASGCAIDNTGTKIYLDGSTQTNGGTSIATTGSHQTTRAAANDAFLVLFSDCVAPNAPVNTTAASNLTLCSNQTTTVSATASGPISWYASASSTVVLGTGGSFITPTLASGTYTYFAETSNTCAASGRTSFTLTVNPLITVNSGSICAGESFTMVPGGVISFTFSNGSAIVNPATTSSYTVTGTDAGGCVGAAVSSIIVNTLPIITVSSGSLCSGKSFTLQPAGASTYTFSGGNAVVSPTSTTSYSVTGTSNEGCTSTVSAVSTLTVSPSPALIAASSRTSICKGESVKLTVSGAVSYSWSAPSSTATFVTVNPTITTIYTVTGTGTNACSSQSMITQNVKACTGLSDNSGIDLSLRIVPNPCSGSFKMITSPDLETGTLEIYNSIGQLILKVRIYAGENAFNLEGQANGIYFIRVSENDRLIGNLKLIKE